MFDVKTQDDFEPEIPHATVAQYGKIWLIARPSIQRWARLIAYRTNTPSGDFVDDLANDGRFGNSDPRSWREMKEYLECRGACDAALRAGRAAFARYKSWCLRHGFDLEAAR